jgi:hypothetical protein
MPELTIITSPYVHSRLRHIHQKQPYYARFDLKGIVQ